MRKELLKVGMSQMSAGSRTDVGAYHRDAGEATQQHLGDLAGQFSLMDHRSSAEVVEDLLKQGYVPSWCTACYRKGRTGEHFMKIAKAGNIHNFCHPNSLLTLQVGLTACCNLCCFARVPACTFCCLPQCTIMAFVGHQQHSCAVRLTSSVPPRPAQEYLNDYASPEVKKLGEEVIAKESEVNLSDSAKSMLQRKLKKVNQGEHDLYI